MLIPILFSCEKDADIEIPNSEPQLVVANFISPNEDSVRLKLTWSTPIYNYSSNPYSHGPESEPNANVIIQKGGIDYPLQFDPLAETYISTVPNFAVGDEVNLKISLEGQPNITSKCTIPPAPKYILEYEGLKEIVYPDGWSEYYFQYKFTCKDIGDNNYYRVNFMRYYRLINTPYYGSMYNEGNELFELSENESVTIRLSFYKDSSQPITYDSLKSFVLKCDENYYKYHLSIQNYQGDDFFVEPSIIYHNVEGGLGVFGAYNMVTDTTIL